MRILLDTHIVLWAVAQSSQISAEARPLLEDTDNLLYCSTASLWEIAIKSGLRRADFEVSLPALREALAQMDIEELPVLGKHTEQLLKLPPLHKDPFDRMLVAQSMAEPLVLLTNDSVLAQYWDGVRLV
ncbi:MAG: type II toxin-antitoxin system VapC family toxin [Xanthomonadaceae bacterium]|nr:type II toxin-antitoxin system VapC family toxin [Xanthomonadaceae bacterium]MDP2184854.1 type II toxin-antitoxin system VapC family toxin [Xanthomonadales bacterium]MDZ4116066.1 type II toxin-antitoxin system VapC family toxin [Xanthomonadaceae bacterium]MDZ4376797.1 type II toxin-antitoxin system VapC family toxin [Xanthomonadaceae bacterium]